jgi:hypothetical protein
VCVCGGGGGGRVRAYAFARVGVRAWEHGHWRILASACLALSIRHATRLRIVVYSLSSPHFSTLSHKRQDFTKRVTDYKMCVLIFSTTFIWNSSYFKKNSARYCHKCENVLMWSTRYSFLILMKHEYSGQIFQKCSNMKFHHNFSSGSRVVLADGRTDRER